jgi:hypothetical protein
MFDMRGGSHGVVFGPRDVIQLRHLIRMEQLADDPQHVFPGHGQMKPEQLEIAQLKLEVAKLRAERDILKTCHGPLPACAR